MECQGEKSKFNKKKKKKNEESIFLRQDKTHADVSNRGDVAGDKKN